MVAVLGVFNFNLITMSKETKLTIPKINDLYNDISIIKKQDQLTVLLNQEPKKEWVKEHPFVKQEVVIQGIKQKVPYKYLPIERVEFLLKSIFKRYRIEITNQGQSFNGVWVTVRVNYINPLNGEWDFHDGIGACQLQTAKGTSAADLANINNGALQMAFPIAKTIAIKDACDHFGKLFGSDLNRKDNISYGLDLTLIPMDENHPNWAKVKEAISNKTATIEQVKEKYQLTEDAEIELSNI